MSISAIIVSILLVIDSLILISIVLLQKGKVAGLSGAIGGAAETYWGKNKARSLEGKFERWTKIVAGLFIVLAIVLYLMM